LFTTPRKPPRGRVTIGLDKTILALRATGRVEPVDTALVSLAREAAAQLQGAVFDPDESRYVRGVLIARYHAVLTHLLARPDADADSVTALERLFAGVDDAS